MKNIMVIVFALLLLFASNLVRADCPGSSTPEMAYCLSLEAEQLDRDLAVTYAHAQQLVDELYGDPKEREKIRRGLENAQRQWSKFRDADCMLIYDSYGTGSGRNVAALSCRIVLAKTRIQQLKEIFSQ